MLAEQGIVPASLPVRGAWIEILRIILTYKIEYGRSPCGERGLKYNKLSYRPDGEESLPVRGAWIEIGNHLQETIY